MHTVFALLCFVVVIHWLIFPYPSGLLHWHCGNLTIAPVPAKQPWWIWINTSCEFIMNDCVTTTKQSTTKPCAYFLGYTVCPTWVKSLTPFMGNSTNHNLCVKCNITTFNYVCRFIVNMFYCDRILFNGFKHAAIKGVRQHFMSTASLEDGHCGTTIPAVQARHMM